MARCCLWLFALYINIKISKKVVKTGLGRLFGKLLFAWLSLVVSVVVSFVLSFFPRDLDEILNLVKELFLL